MNYILGKRPLGYTEKPSGLANPSALLDNYYEWRIKWYYKDGGIKKDWFFGMEDQPIESIEFESNKKLMGNGNFKFTNVDFLIHSGDYVEIFQNSTKIYKGIVDNNIDAKGGQKIKLIPVSQILDERLVNEDFTNKTISDMLQTIIEGLEDSDIQWDVDFVLTGDSSLYSIKFDYVPAKKAIDELVKKLNIKEWGVNVNDKFSVYQYSTTILNKIIFNAEDKYYSELEKKIDDERIKGTRAEVFMKSTESGKTEYVGKVGYDVSGNPYEILSIEKIRRRKDIKYEISANVNSTYALDLAYSELKYAANLSENIKLKNFRIDKYDPNIGDYIKCVDDYEKILTPLRSSTGLDITEDINNWNNNSFNTDDFVSGTGSIGFIGTNPTNSVGYYNFNEIKRYRKGIEKLIFMVKSDDEEGDVIEMGLSENSSTLFNNPYSIFIKNKDTWEMKTITPDETKFRFIGFRLKNVRETQKYFNVLGGHILGSNTIKSNYTQFWIDDINVYTYNRNEYYGNVVQKKYKLDKKGVTCVITLNDYELQDNQELFDMRRDIEKLKEIQQ